MADADLSEGERTVLVLNPHWKTVLWPFVLLVVVAIAAAVLLIVIPHNRLQGAERIAIGAVAIVLAAIWVGVPLLRWKTTTYELTNRRFRLRSGGRSPVPDWRTIARSRRSCSTAPADVPCAAAPPSRSATGCPMPTSCGSGRCAGRRSAVCWRCPSR